MIDTKQSSRSWFREKDLSLHRRGLSLVGIIAGTSYLVSYADDYIVTRGDDECAFVSRQRC